jgi:hypothetical protein
VSNKSSLPKLFIKAPMSRLFVKKNFGRAAYEKIKIEDGIDVEV